jgi:hypothetical protein
MPTPTGSDRLGVSIPAVVTSTSAVGSGWEIRPYGPARGGRRVGSQRRRYLAAPHGRQVAREVAT